jgi:acyl carrier protein
MADPWPCSAATGLDHASLESRSLPESTGYNNKLPWHDDRRAFSFGCLAVNGSAQLHDRVATIVAETFGIAEADVVDDLAYGAIAPWDSVGHLDLLVALERSFGFALTADLIARLTSVRAIEAYLAGTPSR